MHLAHSRLPRFPDPEVSANLYCSGRLDEAIESVLLPLRRGLEDGEGDCYLWFMRYLRRGEHLKIRLHGPGDQRDHLRDLLAAAVPPFLTELEPLQPSPRRQSEALVPPLDEEDFDNGEHPDCSLLWTRYTRNAVVLGPEPLLEDDHYVALLTTCFARSGEILLAGLGEAQRLSFKKLQLLHLETVIAGLGVRPLGAEQRLSYILYHRDSLLRAILRSNRRGRSKMKDFGEMFRRRVELMAPVMAGLRQALESLEERAEADIPGEVAAWRGALGDLLDHLESLRDLYGPHIDLYAREAFFPLLFKVLHVFANQLGLDTLNEAFSYHLLLAALGQEGHCNREPDWLPPFLNLGTEW